MTELTNTMDQAVKAMANREGKYLTFSLAEEEYGIGILKVKEIAYTERTCIIVVEIKRQDSSGLIGIVVDSVSGVLNIKGTDIEDTPTFGTKLDTVWSTT
jgi:purine-binding chemotaxis protein CheW